MMHTSLRGIISRFIPPDAWSSGRRPSTECMLGYATRGYAMEKKK